MICAIHAGLECGILYEKLPGLDFRIECSRDGVSFSQMRVCHMDGAAGRVRFGIYACSPENSSFKAVFSKMSLTDCVWAPHDGQQPDGE